MRAPLSNPHTHNRTLTPRALRFELPNGGLWRATIRGIGFPPANLDLRVGEGENAFIVHLDRTTASLDEVRIAADRPFSARHDDFEERR